MYMAREGKCLDEKNIMFDIYSRKFNYLTSNLPRCYKRIKLPTTGQATKK